MTKTDVSFAENTNIFLCSKMDVSYVIIAKKIISTVIINTEAYQSYFLAAFGFLSFKVISQDISTTFNALIQLIAERMLNYVISFMSAKAAYNLSLSSVSFLCSSLPGTSSLSQLLISLTVLLWFKTYYLSYDSANLTLYIVLNLLSYYQNTSFNI